MAFIKLILLINLDLKSMGQSEKQVKFLFYEY